MTGPDGVAIGEVFCEDEGILYANIDIAACVEPKQIHDISGGYNRFDIFHLTVDRKANRPVTFRGSTPSKELDSEPLTADSADTDQQVDRTN